MKQWWDELMNEEEEKVEEQQEEVELFKLVPQICFDQPVLLSFGVLFLHFAGLVFGVVTSFLCGFAADIFLSFLLVFFLLCLGAGSGLILNMLAFVGEATFSLFLFDRSGVVSQALRRTIFISHVIQCCRDTYNSTLGDLSQTQIFAKIENVEVNCISSLCTGQN